MTTSWLVVFPNKSDALIYSCRGVASATGVAVTAVVPIVRNVRFVLELTGLVSMYFALSGGVSKVGVGVGFTELSVGIRPPCSPEA